MNRLLLSMAITAHTAALLSSNLHADTQPEIPPEKQAEQASVSAPLQEETLVIGNRDSRVIQLAETVAITPDAAQLLRQAPGANVNGNGPLTGIPQYRGMYGDRIKVTVNGTSLSSGGPNWMDPPLSYAPAAQLESLEVIRGIAPVSAGQETIGGAIHAKTWSGDFNEDNSFKIDSRLRLGGQSVNNGSLGSAAFVLANDSHKIKLSALTEQANDAHFSDGDILPTEYQRQRYDLGYGFKTGFHTLQFNFGKNRTGDTGTPALPMDIDYINSELASAHYQFDNASLNVNLRIYGSDIQHGMTNYHLRNAPALKSKYRQNTAKGENRGFSFDINHGNWKMGLDGHREVHDSNIDNINNAKFFVVNFNAAEREILGIFSEYKNEFSNGFEIELGLRLNRAVMDADIVDGTPAKMPMNTGGSMGGGMNNGMNMMSSPGQNLRDNFNAADRQQTDNNIDWVAKSYYKLSNQIELYAGIARKTRSASYQERYLWLPMQSTAGLADGRTYTGNLELKPEVAHEIELGFDSDQGFDNGQNLNLSPHLFYREISDYIQGTASTNTDAIAFVAMMNPMAPAPLEFNNINAELYGFDMDWRYQLNAQWSLGGLLNYVRGKRTDSGQDGSGNSDNLYRIAPLNGSVALTYTGSQDWSTTLEVVAYDQQNKVSSYNGEQKSAAYELLHLRGQWQINRTARLGFGIDNLLDKHYQDHLAGSNRVNGNPDIALNERLPGYGRNAYARIDFEF